MERDADKGFNGQGHPAARPYGAMALHWVGGAQLAALLQDRKEAKSLRFG